jgi:hypothetical protein
VEKIQGVGRITLPQGNRDNPRTWSFHFAQAEKKTDHDAESGRNKPKNGRSHEIFSGEPSPDGIHDIMYRDANDGEQTDAGENQRGFVSPACQRIVANRARGIIVGTQITTILTAHRQSPKAIRLGGPRSEKNTPYRKT